MHQATEAASTDAAEPSEAEAAAAKELARQQKAAAAAVKGTLVLDKALEGGDYTLVFHDVTEPEGSARVAPCFVVLKVEAAPPEEGSPEAEALKEAAAKPTKKGKK